MKQYKFYVSTRKNKKYDAYLNDKFVVSFGDSRYQQYYDKLGAYSYLDHKNNKRRNNYYKRFGIDSIEGTAKYFSHLYLW